jgi:hypothetical protein
VRMRSAAGVPLWQAGIINAHKRTLSRAKRTMTDILSSGRMPERSLLPRSRRKNPGSPVS